jgi:integrase
VTHAQTTKTTCVSAHETKTLAGHSQLKTTEQYYLGSRRRMLELAKKASQRLVGGT